MQTVPLRLLVVSLVLATSASALANAPATSPSDSTSTSSAPDWAQQLVSLDRGLERLQFLADGARLVDAGELADSLLATAAGLAAHPGFANDPAFQRRHFAILTAAEDALGALPEAANPSIFADVRGARLAALDDHGIPHFEGVAVPSEVLFQAFVIPEGHQSLVDRQMARYTGSRTYARSMLSRAGQYFPMIERTLAEFGLPDELKYVAVIESALNPRAVSPAGARGLWQFMPGTGRMYGLGAADLFRPAASTQAAARYLTYLGEMFDGDWQLALAAYNAGPGRVQGIVRRHTRRLGRTPTFWDIQRDLPRETREYVPRFIAVAQLLGEGSIL
ncbi:hypothetical protein BH23BAC4_BH23BAC4_14470 [soil metagenome]